MPGGFSFGWASVEGELEAGPATLRLSIDKAGDNWRQLDAVLITNDLSYEPVFREKPPFQYTTTVGLQPQTSSQWRGALNWSQAGASWNRPPMGGRDFRMWTSFTYNASWWSNMSINNASFTADTLSPYELFFALSPPEDIADEFHTQLAGRKDLPIMSWAGLTPGLYLATPDLSPGSPLRRWFDRTKSPFFIETNYAFPLYNATTGPANFEALTGPLADQFLGYIHGEAVGPADTGFPVTSAQWAAGGVAQPPKGTPRREYVDAAAKQILANEAGVWSKFYNTTVPQSFFSKGISALSVNSVAFCHLFMEMGAQTIAYEEDSSMVNVPQRIAFMRGAARQYNGSWVNYASSNFGDSCNYYTQKPDVPRGATNWYVNKYAITDGPSTTWYRKLYYLNYMSGASAIFWEQGLQNQWMMPGPGVHPVQLSPMGRATEEFQAFVDRLPDRGEPYTPIGVLLSYGHGYEHTSNECRMLEVFLEDTNDRELRELFNVLWHPVGVLEGQPQAPDVQSMPGGIYGNVFDVLVDRPARAKAILDYPVLVVAGDADLASIRPVVEEYVHTGGTLVVNVNAARHGIAEELRGFSLTGETSVGSKWVDDAGGAHPATPFEIAGVELGGAESIAFGSGADGTRRPIVTRNKVGAGAVIVTLVPHMLGLDERAHPALPWLVNGLTDKLMPIEVRLQNKQRPRGEIMYQMNKVQDGWTVLLMNGKGVDKTQSGIARVDRTQHVDVELCTELAVASAVEYTQPRQLKVDSHSGEACVGVRVTPGDVQVVGLKVSGLELE